MARRTKEEAEATRERILDAAEEIFLENGVAQTSLEEIAHLAGVTRGAIYWHFKNKVDVFSALLERVQLPLNELLHEMEEHHRHNPLAALRELCLYALHNLAENPQYRRVYTILFHRCELVNGLNPGVEKQNQQTRQALASVTERFERARRLNQLQPGMSPKTAATALHVFMVGIYSEWLRDPAAFDLSRESEHLLDAFLCGVARRNEVKAAAPRRRTDASG
ncbi:MAG: TetR family transcriptional regulator [Gammaproteobacteria bacterium]|nr:TetR family transcriptional regulator [Gammaproteobacteria bacterium]MBA3731507.1 TetR family transcriptional regulator [Gammaproteobacteria bacterium]